MDTARKIKIINEVGQLEKKKGKKKGKKKIAAKIIEILKKKKDLLKILLLINILNFSDFLSNKSLESNLNL